MNIFIHGLIVFLISISPVFAGTEDVSKQAVTTVSYTHMLNWSVGLIVVLALFFCCVWLVRKMGVLPDTKGSLRVVSALSLGMREKLVLVEVGEKQLLLGVTPGRIDKLLLLEGEDKLFQQMKTGKTTAGDFSQKFKQLMSGAVDE